MLITSLENDNVKKWKKLQKRKYRDEYGQYIVEGLQLVLEAYNSGALVEIILEENMDLPLPCPYTYVTRDILEKVSTLDTPSNIMGLCRKFDRDEVIGDKILILDEVQDPGNLGTIIRSAVAFNIDTIILSENTVDLYNPKVLRATQGMLFHTNIISRNAHEVITILKNMDIPVYGTNVVDGIDVRDLSSDDKKRFALVMGNEGNGVRKEIAEACDKNLYIAMNKDVESLNVAIAASILLYELGR